MQEFFQKIDIFNNNGMQSSILAAKVALAEKEIKELNQ